MSTVYLSAGTGKGYAILSEPAIGETIISLQSLDTSVATVPANVTILNGEMIGEYLITWVGEGSTSIRMSYDGTDVDLTVIALGATFIEGLITATGEISPSISATAEVG